MLIKAHLVFSSIENIASTRSVSRHTVFPLIFFFFFLRRHPCVDAVSHGNNWRPFVPSLLAFRERTLFFNQGFNHEVPTDSVTPLHRTAAALPIDNPVDTFLSNHWLFVCSTLTRIAQNDFYPIMYMHISCVGLCVHGFMNPMPSWFVCVFSQMF